MSLKGSNYPTVRPSLDLPFAQTKRLDPRISYSRSGVATYYDETGILRTAQANEARFDHDPSTGESLGLLVEEARTNQIRSSNNFTYNDWHFTQCKMTPNYAIAPDGTKTAALIQQTDGTSTRQFICTSYSVPAAGSSWTASVYVKKHNYDYVIFGAGDQDSGSRGTRFGYLQAQLRFQFSTKTLTVNPSTNWGGAVTGSGYEELPNGWFRLWVSKASFPRANHWGIAVQSALTGATEISGDLNLVTGDGTSGVYFWGLQWEYGAFKTSHIPTPATFTSRSTTATYYDANGVIQTAGANVARDNAYLPDSNGVMRPAGLLLEEARTNGDTASATLSNWGESNATFADQTITTPDGSTTAKLLTEDTSTDIHQIDRVYDNIYTGHALSFFVKPNGRTKFRIRLDTTTGGQPVDFDLANMTVTPGASNRSGSIQKFPNGWFRISAVLIGGYRGYCEFRMLDNSGNETYTGDGTSGAYIWGVQYEKAAPYSSSYIPTTTATVTRAADVSSSSTVTRSADVAQITGSNFSSWYNQSEGSFFLHERNSYGTFLNHRFEINQNSSSNSNAISFTVNYGNGTRITSRDSNISGSIDRTLTNVWTSGGSHKYAYGLEQDNFSVVSGANSVTDTSGTFPPNLDSLSFGAVARSTSLSNGGGKFLISRLTYYPVRLPDAVLQKITE